MSKIDWLYYDTSGKIHLNLKFLITLTAKIAEHVINFSFFNCLTVLIIINFWG